MGKIGEIFGVTDSLECGMASILLQDVQHVHLDIYKFMYVLYVYAYMHTYIPKYIQI